MNIKILDSWLREYLDTDADHHTIAEALSLTSVGVEKIDPQGKNDYVYDIEVTTNRVDLMSIIGLAREAGAVLPHFGKKATFSPLKVTAPKTNSPTAHITIKNDPKLVNRINAVVMEVEIGDSPQNIKTRLETSDIRSLNNLIDITNYVMRETGHPCHVFDFDRLGTEELVIRMADKGEEIVTLDNKRYVLHGGEIVADNGNGEIVDLLGIMGLENSVVTEHTKRILLFLDNNDPHRIRRASMALGIRTEAAQLNEKGVDRQHMYDAFLRAIELYRTLAKGKIVSDLIDIYPNQQPQKDVEVNIQKISAIIGVPVPVEKSIETLEKLGFKTKKKSDSLHVTVPSWRYDDVSIQEDIIEEIARTYGYHNLESILPPHNLTSHYHVAQDRFYWERTIKNMLTHWGFTETYTYSMVSKDMIETTPDHVVTIKNPLTEDNVHMRTSLVPSLLEVIRNNPARTDISIFEMANIYLKKTNDLPEEVTTLAFVISKPKANFFEAKGTVEQLLENLGVKQYEFKKSAQAGLTADIVIQSQTVGVTELLDKHIVYAEINVDRLLEFVNLKRVFTPLSKYPPIIEDLRLQIPEGVYYQQVVDCITSQSTLVKKVSLLDVYQDKKTIRIHYQSDKGNLSDSDIQVVRDQIIQSLKKKLRTHVV